MAITNEDRYNCINHISIKNNTMKAEEDILDRERQQITFSEQQRSISIASMQDNAMKFAKWLLKYEWESAQNYHEEWQRAATVNERGMVLYQYSTTEGLYELYSNSPE